VHTYIIIIASDIISAEKQGGYFFGAVCFICLSAKFSKKITQIMINFCEGWRLVQGASGNILVCVQELFNRDSFIKSVVFARWQHHFSNH